LWVLSSFVEHVTSCNLSWLLSIQHPLNHLQNAPVHPLPNGAPKYQNAIKIKTIKTPIYTKVTIPI